MSLQEKLDAINREYENAENAAKSWQGINAQAQHDAHLVMQRLVAERNDAIEAANRASVNTSSPAPAGPPPPEAKPVNPWITTTSYAEPVGVKQADPDIVFFDSETISPELLIQLEYENISGSELINITRSDIIDGQKVVYSPIKNLSALRRKYNPNNIIAISSTSESIFSKYLIDLIGRGIKEPYFDDNGNLVVEVEDVFDDEVIEVEIDVNGTIDTVEFL